MKNIKVFVKDTFTKENAKKAAKVVGQTALVALAAGAGFVVGVLVTQPKNETGVIVEEVPGEEAVSMPEIPADAQL